MADFGGLLDFIKTPEGQGLLSATFGGMAGARQGTPWNNAGRAGVAGIMGYGGALDRQTQQTEAAQMAKYRQAQMDNYNSEIEQRKAAIEAAKNKQSVLGKMYDTGSEGAPALSVDSMLPPEFRTGLPAIPAVQPRAAGVRQDMIPQAIAAGISAEELTKLSALSNLGKQEVARTIKGIGSDGREYEYQIDKFGQKIGDGFSQWKAPILNDGGGQTNVLDPYNPLKPIGAIPKTMTFGDRNAAATLGLSRERLAFEKAGGAEGAKPQLVDGQWVYKPDAQNPQGRVVAVQGMADKPLNDSQGKANLFGNRMVEAEKAFQSVQDKADRPGWLKRTTQATVGLVPFAGDKLSDVAGSALNWTQSAPQQQVEQAKEDFINALMRRESGAVIGRDEFTNADKQYFPQVGDSDAKIAQKARNRQTAIDGIMAEVPRSRNSAPVAPPAKPGSGYSDPNKESRYQAWLRTNKG